MIVRGAFNELLRPDARKAYMDEYQELPAEYPMVFNILTSQRAWEEEMYMTGLGVAIEKPEGTKIAMDKPKFLGKVRITHRTFGLGYEITREAVEDDLYGLLTRNGSRNLARALRETEELTAWSIVNGMFTTTLGYDGLPIISDSHPILGGGVVSNKANPGVDLSTTALQASIERFLLLKNDRGFNINIAPKRLLTSVTEQWTAQEILGSEFNLDVADAGSGNVITPNVVRKFGITPIFSRRLTDPDAFFVLADKSQTKFTFYWRRKPQYDDDYRKREQVSEHYIHARFSAGINDWHGIDGSTGI